MNVRSESGRPKPKKYVQLFSMKYKRRGVSQPAAGVVIVCASEVHVSSLVIHVVHPEAAIRLTGVEPLVLERVQSIEDAHAHQ